MRKNLILAKFEESELLMSVHSEETGLQLTMHAIEGKTIKFDVDLKGVAIIGRISQVVHCGETTFIVVTNNENKQQKYRLDWFRFTSKLFSNCLLLEAKRSLS